MVNILFGFPLVSCAKSGCTVLINSHPANRSAKPSDQSLSHRPAPAEGLRSFRGEAQQREGRVVWGFLARAQGGLPPCPFGDASPTTEIGSKMGGEFTYSKMVPLV